jgi:erythromycin esterase-like protein
VFIKWAQQQQLSFDLKKEASMEMLVKQMGQDIGAAKVVLLSEGFHNCEEMLRLQLALVKYLVREKGFTVVASESGLPESRYINEYIQGKPAIPQLWEKGLAEMYSEWETGRALVEWLLEYNQLDTNQVDYVGVDIGGSYKDWEFPFEQVFDYLDHVDAATGQQLKADLAPYFELMKPYAAYYYTTRVTPEQRDLMARLLDDLIQTFRKKQASYVAKSSLRDYEWILQAVKAMRWAEQYYRSYQRVNDTTAHVVPLHSGMNGRELAMAENIKWLLSYKKDAKIIVLNHVLHTKTATQYQGDFYQYFTPMGQFLKQELGEALFVIGMSYGGGQYWNGWQVPSRRRVDTIPESDSLGLERILQTVATQDYYLHLKKPPLLSYKWLNTAINLRENDYQIVVQPIEWDAYFFLQEVTPARAAK